MITLSIRLSLLHQHLTYIYTHCEFTTVNVAISIISIKYEIVSVVTLPRKDIVTHLSPRNGNQVAGIGAENGQQQDQQ